jgi:hypothetical protein
VRGGSGSETLVASAIPSHTSSLRRAQVCTVLGHAKSCRVTSRRHDGVRLLWVCGRMEMDDCRLCQVKPCSCQVMSSHVNSVCAHCEYVAAWTTASSHVKSRGEESHCGYAAAWTTAGSSASSCRVSSCRLVRAQPSPRSIEAARRRERKSSGPLLRGRTHQAHAASTRHAHRAHARIEHTHRARDKHTACVRRDRRCGATRENHESTTATMGEGGPSVRLVPRPLARTHAKLNGPTRVSSVLEPFGGSVMLRSVLGGLALGLGWRGGGVE